MTDFCETPINVLGFFNEDDDVWSVVALELDLWGFGDSKEESLQELVEIIEMQMNFSEYKENPELLLHPAPAMYFRMHAQASENALRANAFHREKEEDTFAGGMPFPQLQNNHNFASV